MPKTIPVVSLVDLRFNEIARMGDAGVWGEFILTQRLSRTPLFRRSVQWNAYRVTRTATAVTLHLLILGSEGAEPRRAAIFNFYPAQILVGCSEIIALQDTIMEASGQFNILCLDGGGAKGVYALGFLRELEASAGMPLTKLFDAIYGTSTGAIIAALLGLGYTSDEALKLYLEYVPTILKPKLPSAKSRGSSDYW